MGRRSISFQEFMERFESVSNGEYRYIGGYTKMSDKIQVEHLVCGHPFEVVASAFITTQTKCKKCANKIIAIKNTNNAKEKKNHKEYIKEKTNGEYELVSEYIGYRKEAMFKHNTCGHIYPTKYNLFEKGNRCPKCNKGTRYTVSDIETNYPVKDVKVLNVYYPGPQIEIQCLKCNTTKKVGLTTYKNYKFACCKKAIKSKSR